jgi:hypothetical protein
MSYYAEKDFFEDLALIEFAQKVMSGELRLDWYAARTAPARCAPADPARGLTYADCNVGPYGYDAIPELVRGKNSMAARGSEVPPGLPDLGYTVNRKSDVWADNVVPLYEEAKSRRWTPAVDVAWKALLEAPRVPEREAAMAQACTFLEEVALVAMEGPSRWVYAMNQEFLEVKSFLCAQMIDAARHVEVFRKRALISGQGLKRASVTAEQALKELLLADTYPLASLALNVLLGSFALGAYRHLAAVADNAVDRRLFTLAMQDAARAIAYGVGQLRYHLTHQPDQSTAVSTYLDQTEHTWLGLAGSPEFIEPLVILSGGGLDAAQTARGAEVARRWIGRTIDEYLERVERAGLPDRRRQSRLPAYVARLQAA